MKLRHYVVLYTLGQRKENICENYLRPFEIAVKKGKANGIMSAFNRVGSVWAGANHGLLTNILRDEWGFNGSVVTDWMGGAGNAAEGLASGNDLWLNGAQNMSHNLGSNWSKDVLKANRVRTSTAKTFYSNYVIHNTFITMLKITLVQEIKSLALIDLNHIGYLPLQA